MEKLANELTLRLSRSYVLSEEQREITEYSLLVFLQTGLSIVLIVLAGLLMHSLLSCLVVALAGALLRFFTGGAHYSKPITCSVMTMISIVLFISLGHFLSPVMTYICLSTSLILVWRFAPVDSQNRPLTPEKKYSLKWQSRVIFLILSGAVAFLMPNYNSSIWGAITLGWLFQAISLTATGHRFFHFVDRCALKLSR